MMNIIYSHICGWHVGPPSWSLFWNEVGYQGQMITSVVFEYSKHTGGVAKAKREQDVGAVPLFLGFQSSMPGRTR